MMLCVLAVGVTCAALSTRPACCPPDPLCLLCSADVVNPAQPRRRPRQHNGAYSWGAPPRVLARLACFCQATLPLPTMLTPSPGTPPIYLCRSNPFLFMKGRKYIILSLRALLRTLRGKEAAPSRPLPAPHRPVPPQTRARRGTKTATCRRASGRQQHRKGNDKKKKKKWPSEAPRRPATHTGRQQAAAAGRVAHDATTRAPPRHPHPLPYYKTHKSGAPTILVLRR